MSTNKTIRRNWLKRQIEKGLIEIKCTGIYTDDYYGDNANSFHKTEWELANIKDFKDEDFRFASGYAYQDENGIIHWTMLANHFYLCRVITPDQQEAYISDSLSTSTVDSEGELTGFEGIDSDEIRDLIAETIIENTPHAEPEVSFGPATEYTVVEDEPKTDPLAEAKATIRSAVRMLGLDPDIFFNIELGMQVSLLGFYTADKAQAIIKAGYPMQVDEHGRLIYSTTDLRIVLT